MLFWRTRTSYRSEHRVAQACEAKKYPVTLRVGCIEITWSDAFVRARRSRGDAVAFPPERDQRASASAGPIVGFRHLLASAREASTQSERRAAPNRPDHP